MRLLTIVLTAFVLLAGNHAAFAHALLRHTVPRSAQP